MVGTLRMDAARHPDEPRTARLVGELSLHCESFRRWWAGQKVVDRGPGVKAPHPLIGEITLATEGRDVPGRSRPDALRLAGHARDTGQAGARSAGDVQYYS